MAFTLSRNMLCPASLPLMRTPRLPAVPLNWPPSLPARFKWTRLFRRKTKSDLCACAVTFSTGLYHRSLVQSRVSLIATSCGFICFGVTFCSYIQGSWNCLQSDSLPDPSSNDAECIFFWGGGHRLSFFFNLIASFIETTPRNVYSFPFPPPFFPLQHDI